MFQEKTVFITGASSGIGEALAYAFAAEGAHVALAARRVDRLEQVALRCRELGVQAIAVECDVTDDVSVESALARARAELGGLDILVANAGFGVGGNFDDLQLADYRRQFETNVFGVLRCAKFAAQDLRQSRGRLVVLGSVAGHIALPSSSPYSMSKFAVRAFADSLRAEWTPWGVSVTLITPGFVASEIRRRDPAGQLHEKDPIPSWLVMPAKRAAQDILKAVRLRRAEAVITLHGKLLVWIHRLLPSLVDFLRRRGLVRRPSASVVPPLRAPRNAPKD